MSTRLPPFSSLLALDAVARHGTLTRAAIELNVTQPAVSRRIAALEADLGRPLLDRRTKPLTLNQDGLELFEVLRSTFGRLETVVERLRRPNDHHGVTISAGAGLTAYLLIPRLPQIEAAFPELQIRIISRPHEDEEERAGDLDIRFGDGKWHGRTVIKFLGEDVFPVCSPRYLGRRKVPFSAEQLGSSRLLDMKVRQPLWYNWATWFDAVRFPRPVPPRVVYLDSYPIVVDAAISGDGVCLAWAGLLDALLKSGVLVRVTPQSATSERGYFLMHDPKLPRDGPARLVARWLIENFGHPGTRCPSPAQY